MFVRVSGCCQPYEREQNANIQLVASSTNDLVSRERPLLAVGYGPRCVPVMQLTAAAAGLCDLLWLIDASLPEMHEMVELLDRFGPVVDIGGLSVEAILKELTPPYQPDGIVTYLDANMSTFARVAEALELPFHSVRTAVALTNKFEQRRELREAGLATPNCFEIGPQQGVDDLEWLDAAWEWPAVLKPRSAQGSRYTFLVKDRARLDEFLNALGPTRPIMILEDYLDDDPLREGESYAPYVSVESVVARGVISHLALTGRFPLAENFRETGFFIPAALNDDDEVAALDLASLAIEALGVTTGCLHTEVKFTSDGPRIIEVNGRVGGGVPEMLYRAAGFALNEMTMNLALGANIQVDGPVATERGE
jgi:biotin carboxylase